MMAGMATVLSPMWMSGTPAVREKENPSLQKLAQWNVIAMNDPDGAYDYPSEVTDQLPQNDLQAYRDLAEAYFRRLARDAVETGGASQNKPAEEHKK